MSISVRYSVLFVLIYDTFYHGNFKFKAKLGLDAVLLTFSYHLDSEMGHVINYLPTGCSCRTRKYKPLVFQTALASLTSGESKAKNRL